MSKKINPLAMRIGVTQPWKSLWFAEGNDYANKILEDDKIRTHLHKSLKTAGLGDVIIERSIKSLKILIRVARPGIVIGRKGVGLSDIREKMKKFTKADIDLQIEEVKQPEKNASIVADSIAMQLEKRIAPKRAMNMAADKAMEAGAKGIRIEASGTLFGPNSIAMTQITTRGAIPTQTIRADIDYAQSISYTRGGTIGVKVWLYKGEIES